MSNQESSMLQCVAVCCSVLQCVAVCCSVLQCVTDKMSKQDKTYVGGFPVNAHYTLQHTETHCNPQQPTATHCSPLQHTRQHTATNSPMNEMVVEAQ